MSRTRVACRGVAARAGLDPTCLSGRFEFERPFRSRAGAVVGLVALGVLAVQCTAIEGASIAELSESARPHEEPRGAAPESGSDAMAGLDRRIMVGGYGGTTYTYPSTVTIRNPGQTDMTVSDFGWIGRPFKSPIYYGLRAINWPRSSRLGGMIDFTHAKAIANPDDVATFTGTADGKPVPPKGRIGEMFRHLEFSHGHNMVTLNGMMRLGGVLPRLSPYVGIGGGVSLPHTEIAMRSENGRTYEYQYAGVVGQGLAGIEVRLGRASVFLEYKLSYAPYDVPLSGVVNGWLLVTDLWRQANAWAKGEKPPRGTLQTRLVTHHGIAGVLVRASGPGQ